MAWGLGLRAGAGILSKAGKLLTRLGGTKAAANVIKPVTNVTSLVKYSPQVAKVGATAAKAAPVAGGGIHPLGMLANYFNPIGKPLWHNALNAATVVGGYNAAVDYTSDKSIGSGSVNRLNSTGKSFSDDLSWWDNGRARVGSLLTGDIGGIFADPNSDSGILKEAQNQRNKDFDAAYRGDIAKNNVLLGGLLDLNEKGGNYTGRSKEDVEAGIASDQSRGGALGTLLGTEGGIEKVAGLSRSSSAQQLAGATTQLVADNRDKAEQKVLTERKRQEKVRSDELREEREARLANERLQLLLNDNALARQDKETAAAREERNYLTMLELKEKRAQRKDQRIRDERTAQREMISVLLGGLNNAFN